MRMITGAALFFPGLMAIGCLAACHSFSTQEAAPGSDQVSIGSSRVNGLIYYLPKGRIRISGDFKSGSGDGGGAAPNPVRQRALNCSLVCLVVRPEVNRQSKKNFVVTIAADIEADPNARYYLKPVRNYFYDDDIKLSVNGKHLLSTGTRLLKIKPRRSFQQQRA